MAKVGRPRKAQSKAVSVKADASASVETPVSGGTTVMSGESFEAPPDPDREELYKRYFEAEQGDGIKDELTEEIRETVSEDTADNEVSADTAVENEPVKEDVKTEEYVKEEPVVTQESEPVKAEKEVKDKTVPLQALHEERERRKQIQRELKEMREKQLLYERQMQALYQSQTQPQIDESELSDYDKALLALNRQNQQLAQQQEAIARAIEADRQTRELQAISQNIQHTGLELEKEGFPHFLEMQDMVVAEMKRLYAEDPENFYEFPDNPLGWKKAYREVVYPKLQRLGGGTAKTASLDAKRALKQNAQLAGTTGQGSVPKVDTNKKDVSYQDMLENYRKMRGMSA